MSDGKISDLLNVEGRFLRSAHLERDFRDPGMLSGYVVTDFARSSLARIAEGLKPGSGQRAWRVTGHYGAGKSSFALFLAHLVAGRETNLRSTILTNSSTSANRVRMRAQSRLALVRQNK
jgi:hypothetical protein